MTSASRPSFSRGSEASSPPSSRAKQASAVDPFVKYAFRLADGATIEAVEQLTRYLERLRSDPAMADCTGVLAAQQIKPQARTLAESRGMRCVEVDLAVLRGEREPDLTLFG